MENKHHILWDYSRINGSGKVKDHCIWDHEYKPWTVPQWPVHGSHSSIEHHYLYRTAFRLGKGNYANLGVYLGASTNALVCGVAPHGGHVYGVDLFETSKMYPDALEKLKVEHEFRDRGVSKLYLTLCKGLTNEWAERFTKSKRYGGTKFKLIFIDADHEYKAVLEDFKLWSPLLEPEGLLVFHDVQMETVHRVITEELDDWELVDHIFMIKSFKRKGK